MLHSKYVGEVTRSEGSERAERIKPRANEVLPAPKGPERKTMSPAWAVRARRAPKISVEVGVGRWMQGWAVWRDEAVVVLR